MCNVLISNSLSLFTGIEIGLQLANYAVNEIDGSVAMLEVCAELNVGALERGVMVTLTSTDGSATSTSK